MTEEPKGVLRFAGNGLETLIWLAGLGLIAYLSAGVLGFVSRAPGFYVSFALGIVLLCGLLAMKQLVDDFAVRGVRLGSAAWLLIVVASTVAGLIGFGYMRMNIQELTMTAPFFDDFAIMMGFLIIPAVVLLTWFHWGWILATICGGAILYFFYGQHIPIPLLRHAGYDTPFIMNYVALHTNQGFFNFINVAADDLYFLILFGVTLLGAGMLRMVLELGKAAGRRVRGGAALPAVFGSTAIGSVMGQAVSNVALTGRLTIPMMKQYGYSPTMAGAIEATASTAGQIIPPVLGLAGFLIASFLGIPYPEVALAALIPAALYLLGTATAIAVYAYRTNTPRLNEVVDWKLVLRMMPTFVLALTAVIWLLMGFRAAGYAGLTGMAITLTLSLFQGPYRPSIKDLREALREGIYLTSILALLIIAVGPIGQVVVTTDLTGRLASYLVTVLPEIDLLLLVGAMILCILLGLGLPTPVAYIMGALTMVPFLREIGIAGLHAHFFVFYFAVFSTLSPPIAVSVLAASKLAGASFWATCMQALKIAGTTFIIPFAFVYNPSLLSFPNVGPEVLWPMATVIATQVAVAIAAYGYCIQSLGWQMRTAWALVGLAGYATVTAGGSVIFDLLLFGGAALLVLISFLAARRAPQATVNGHTNA